MKPKVLAPALALVALVFCAKAQAQSFSELALDGRPDRLQKLAAGAQKEGGLTLYAMPSHRAWVPKFLNVFVQAYNTSLVGKEDLPKSYAELANRKWKGRLGVEASDGEWYCGVLKNVGEERGARRFRDIAAMAGWSVRSGHTLLANLVASGEVPLALTVYSYRIEQLKSAGGPVEWFGIDPVIGRANGAGVSRRPPHPNAALLFYEYLISDAQPLM